MVTRRAFPGAMSTDTWPSMVKVWRTGSWLLTCTAAPPAARSRCFGWKAMLRAATCTSPALAGSSVLLAVATTQTTTPTMPMAAAPAREREATTSGKPTRIPIRLSSISRPDTRMTRAATKATPPPGCASSGNECGALPSRYTIPATASRTGPRRPEPPKPHRCGQTRHHERHDGERRDELAGEDNLHHHRTDDVS